MEALVSEVRLALRRLARRPGFTSIAVGTLALGIGGATAIFSVADAVILRPLLYADSDRLVVLWHADRARNQSFLEMSYPAYQYWRNENRAFEQLAGMTNVNWAWTHARDEATGQTRWRWERRGGSVGGPRGGAVCTLLGVGATEHPRRGGKRT